jgi:hypothetical protein
MSEVIYKAEWHRVLLCVPEYINLSHRGSVEVRRGLRHYIGIASVMLY